MVNAFAHRALILGAVLIAGNCNMEVGNPESEFADLGRAQSAIQTLDFQLAAKQPCTTITSDCTAVPIVLADASATTYTFEMTRANLQLNAVEMKPYAADSIITRLDLLAGTQVSLSQAVDSSAVTEMVLTFSGSANAKAETLSLRGILVAKSAAETTTVPLRLNFSSSIMAKTSVNAGSDAIQSAQFDAAAWFDFSSAGNSAAKLMANLSGGPCSEPLSHSCEYYQDSLARLIGERISKSLSIKTKPTNQKAFSKGKLGG